MEKDKIKGAIRTDFILSAEIIADFTRLGRHGTIHNLRVGAGPASPSPRRVGVYGFVAAIVKLDDGGPFSSHPNRRWLFGLVQRAFGAGILTTAPWLMRRLGRRGHGGNVSRGRRHTHPRVLPGAHSWIECSADGMVHLPAIGGALQWLTPLMLDGVAGILAGALVLAMVSGARHVIPVIHPRRASGHHGSKVLSNLLEPRQLPCLQSASDRTWPSLVRSGKGGLPKKEAVATAQARAVREVIDLAIPRCGESRGK